MGNRWLPEFHLRGPPKKKTDNKISSSLIVKPFFTSLIERREQVIHRKTLSERNPGYKLSRKDLFRRATQYIKTIFLYTVQTLANFLYLSEKQYEFLRNIRSVIEIRELGRILHRGGGLYPGLRYLDISEDARRVE